MYGVYGVYGVYAVEVSTRGVVDSLVAPLVVLVVVVGLVFLHLPLPPTTALIQSTYWPTLV